MSILVLLALFIFLKEATKQKLFVGKEDDNPFKK